MCSVKKTQFTYWCLIETWLKLESARKVRVKLTYIMPKK